MVLISVNRAIKYFGFIEGIIFWLEWKIKIKIELFFYQYILRKKWCSWHGYSCNLKCKYPKYDKPIEFNETMFNEI